MTRETSESPDADATASVQGPHVCLDEDQLRPLVKRLLHAHRQPEDFLAATLAEPRVGGCERCHAHVLWIAGTLADDEREACVSRFERASPAQVCFGVKSSHPRAWPPVPRWPEVEAVVDSRRVGAGSRFLEVLCSLQADSTRDETSSHALMFLRDYLRCNASPPELALAGVLAGSPRLQARAYRQQGAACETSESRWDEAAEHLDPSSHASSAPAEARRTTTRALAQRRARVTPRRALGFANVIDNAVSHLDQLEAVASQLCSETTRRGYAYSVVNLVRIEEGTIEAVAGTGESAKWVGRVRHPIHPKQVFPKQDIQCDIVLNERAELVPPNDDRLDPFIQKHFAHVLPRFFIPLVVVYDARGVAINSKCAWRPVPNARNPTLELDVPPGSVARIFGTIEIGINAHQVDEAVDDFVSLAMFATKRAPELYRCTLANVLDKIVFVVRRLLQAPSATLHLGKVCDGGVRFYADYCFRSDARRAISWLSASEHTNGDIGDTPRPDGLGIEALMVHKPRTRRGTLLAMSNPKIWNQGYTSMTAFPFFAGREVGLLYLHQREEQEPDFEEMPWVKFVVERAARVIRVAMAYAAERHRCSQILGQLKAVNALSGSAHLKEEERERLATGSMLGLSAADMTLLFRVGGRRREGRPTCSSGIKLGPASDQCLLARIVDSVAESAQSRYLSRKDIEGALALGEVAANSDAELAAHIASAAPFLLRERIRYLAAIPVSCDSRVSAVLVLAYRRGIDLSESERRHLELVVSSVSLALGLSGTGVGSSGRDGQSAALKQLTGDGALYDSADSPRVFTAWSAAAEVSSEMLRPPDSRKMLSESEWTKDLTLDRPRVKTARLTVDPRFRPPQ